ncbi:MAG: hypothetical protein M3A44_10515 [Gammaproteobacteria bacterium]
MNILDIMGFTHGATEVTIALSYLAVLVGTAVICGLLAQWDQRSAIENGVHVKSKSNVRHLYLASEEPVCAPPSKHTLKLDPINAMYDEEFSYPEKCQPLKLYEETIEHAAMEGKLKKAA